MSLSSLRTAASTRHLAVRAFIAAGALIAAVATVSVTATTQHPGSHADGTPSVAVCIPTPTVSCPSPIHTDGVQMWD